MSEYLFLYGTLRPELAPEGMNPLVCRLERLGAGWVRGRIYDLGKYPGLISDTSEIADGAGEVKGCLFRLPGDPEILERLDEFEGFLAGQEDTSLFVRRLLRVYPLEGGQLDAWTYVYNRDPGTAPVVPSGDYLALCRKRERARPNDTGGLPLRERVFTRLLLRVLPALWSISRATASSRRSIGRAVDLLDIPDEAVTRPSTVKRVLAIEESTRHWSLAQVAEHLIIVNRGIVQIVSALGRGEDPGPVWTILDVKPAGRPTSEIRRELARLPDELEAAAAAVEDWRSPLRHPHTWFGRLDAKKWWILNALHNRIHLEQARRIGRILGPWRGKPTAS